MIFYSSGLVICLSFIFVARSWARIIVPWNAIDIIMLYPPYAPTKRTLRRKLFTTGWIMVVVTLGEFRDQTEESHMHLLSPLFSRTLSVLCIQLL